MGSAESRTGPRQTEYEHLLYECQRQRARLEAKMSELELQNEKLKRENASLKSQIDDLEKSKATQHRLRRFGPMGKPLVW